jgi:exopolysaccharide biosynthesis polyprenyl glycosylphosphotransferase
MPIKPMVKIKRYLLILGDVTFLYLALWLTLYLRYGQKWSLAWEQHFYPFSIIYALMLVVFYIIGLYELSIARNNLNFFNTLTKGLASGALIAISFFYLIPYFVIAPKTNLFLDLIIAALLLTGWRQIYNYFIKTSALLNNVLVMGQTKETEELIDFIKRHPQLGFRIRKVVEPSELKILQQLIEVLIQEKIQIVVTAANPYKDKTLVRNLYQCLPLQISVIDLPAFYERLTAKIPVSAIEEIWFLENLMSGKKSFFESAKRIVDFILAIIGSVATVILTPLIALLIKIDSTGPVFYRQKRVGKDNRLFEIIKFRTMVKDAEKAGAQWAKENDGRVTRVGRFLRKTRLDELPQFFNILRGDMSFVGPRPERPEFAFSNELTSQIHFYQIRHIVKPGATGWAQIKYPYGASVADTMQKLQYDLYYIKNRSLIFDLAIILKTIRIVLGGGGR